MKEANITKLPSSNIEKSCLYLNNLIVFLRRAPWTFFTILWHFTIHLEALWTDHQTRRVHEECCYNVVGLQDLHGVNVIHDTRWVDLLIHCVTLPTGWTSAWFTAVRFIFWTSPGKDRTAHHVMKKLFSPLDLYFSLLSALWVTLQYVYPYYWLLRQ